jgi:hypothetical protein
MIYEKSRSKINRKCTPRIRKGKEFIMTIRIYLFALVLFVVCLPAVHAQEYGKIRALQQRADFIIKLKNDFIARVLTSYTVPHERNAQGAVVRINMDGHWRDVTAIEIVPVLKEGVDKNQQVVAHELFFYTSDGILDVVSELTIR